MTFERVHRSRSQSPQSSSSTSQFAPRPFPVQEPKRPPTQEDIENDAFQQNKFEAFGLQLKEKHGTITPVEQEKLGMLQAKMDSFWVQRMERAKAQPNLLEILIRNAQTAQVTEPAAPVQPKLTVGQPNDQYEQEADRVAEQVMSMAPPVTPNIQRQTEEEQEEIQTKPLVETITPIVQRQEVLEEDEPIQAKCESCEGEEQVQRSPNGVPQVEANLESRLNASKGGGSPLPNEVRGFMEPRFGTDFSQVRVHTDSAAVQMNQELGAQAFTHDSHIYYGAGKAPAKDQLTGHELTHVVQQRGMQAYSEDPLNTSSNVQRLSWSDVTGTAERIGSGIADAATAVGERVGEGIDYLKGRPERQRAERERPERGRDDPGSFCTPYTSRAEVYAAKTYLWASLIPAATGMFGTDVAGLWRQYLSSPSSGYRTFANGSNIANAFAQCEVIQQYSETLMSLATTRLDRFNTQPANTWVDVPIGVVFTPDEINFPVNFNNPFDIPGHIAGGVSGSAFGSDSRQLKGHLSVFRETDDTGNTIGYQLKSKFEFEVRDAVDFCPGGIGAGLEQVLTVPLSRLEASGQAFDVPFIVQFNLPEITRTTSLSSSGVSSSNPLDRHRGDRQDVTRGMEGASRRP
jgi:hypothetical protein